MPDPAISLALEVPFPKSVGITDDAETGGLALHEADSRKNHVGTMHAGALFTLGESASGLAMMRALAPVLSGALPVVKNATISYLKPARGGVHATARVSEAIEAISARFVADSKATFDISVSLQDGDVERRGRDHDCHLVCARSALMTRQSPHRLT